MADNSDRQWCYARGEKVYFRYLTAEDAMGDWHRWFNCPKITSNLADQVWPNSVDNQLQHLAIINQRVDRLAVAICDVSTDMMIGIGGLSGMNQLHRRAEISIVIGSEEHRNGVITLEGLALLTEIGFSKFNLNKIIATSLASSDGGAGITKLLGYKEAGCFKNHVWVNGKWEDVIFMEVMQKDWLTSNKRPNLLR